MMKKLIYLLAFLVTFSACSDDEKAPAPEVSDVVIEGSTGEDPLRIEAGEPLSFSLKLQESANVTYSWLLDGKEVSTDTKYTFTPEKIGTYKLTVVVKNNDGVPTTKEIGTITVVYPIPVTTNLFCGEEIAPEEIDVTASSELSFKVEAKKASDVTYYWIINGDTIKDQNEATLDYNLGLSGTLKVSLVNKDEVSVNKEIELVGPYKDGTYIFGTSYTGLCYIGKDGIQEKDNIFETVNPGQKLGDNGVNDFQIYNNKAYILVPTISSSDKRAQIVVADAQTMKKIKAISAESFTSAKLGTIYNLTIVNEDKAYIGSNNIFAKNTSSVRVFDMKERVVAEEAIEGTSGNFMAAPVEGPAWARMLNVGNHTLVACGGKIQVISHETDKVEQTINIEDAKQVADIVKGRDKNIYALVNSQTSGSPAFIAKINPETFTVESTTNMVYNNKNLSFNGGGTANSRTAISPVSDDILFSVAGAYSWSPSSEIYKYNYTSKEVTLFADVKNDSRATAINGYMGIDSKGTLIVPLSGAYSYQNEAIIAYDVKTGKLQETEYKRIGGEGNAIPTWMFQ